MEAARISDTRNAIPRKSFPDDNYTWWRLQSARIGLSARCRILLKRRANWHWATVRCTPSRHPWHQLCAVRRQNRLVRGAPQGGRTYCTFRQCDWAKREGGQADTSCRAGGAIKKKRRQAKERGPFRFQLTRDLAVERERTRREMPDSRPFCRTMGGRGLIGRVLIALAGMGMRSSLSRFPGSHISHISRSLARSYPERDDEIRPKTDLSSPMFPIRVSSSNVRRKLRDHNSKGLVTRKPSPRSCTGR